jgi:hypothetical protein
MPSLRADAGCGSCVYTDQNLPRKFLSQAKWDCLRMTLTWFADLVRRNQKAPRKAVLKKRGYLVYCTITYPFSPPI